MGLSSGVRIRSSDGSEMNDLTRPCGSSTGAGYTMMKATSDVIHCIAFVSIWISDRLFEEHSTWTAIVCTVVLQTVLVYAYCDKLCDCNNFGANKGKSSQIHTVPFLSAAGHGPFYDVLCTVCTLVATCCQKNTQDLESTEHNDSTIPL